MAISAQLPILTNLGGDNQRPTTVQRPWVQVLAHLDPKYGGMSAAVPALGSAVSNTGNRLVSLAAFCDPGETVPPALTNDLPVFRLQLSRALWMKDGRARESFQNLISTAAGIHIHGLWEHSTLVAARAARSAGKPYLISAHGMLQRWALNNKRWKKVIYSALVESTNLRRARCLHALTTAEARDYRAYGLRNPIAVIPNGVDLPVHADSEVFLRTFPHLRGKRLVLFLSRIHFKKGLDILCKAWASIATRWPGAHLVLAGPDFENTRSAIESLITEAGLATRVTFTGMLDKTLKWSAFSAAECFVLPSYSEGLSISILEAMGMGLPVIITRECNLPEVEEHGCGWVIGATERELQNALHECLLAPSSSLAEMSLNGRRWVEKDYSWRVVGERMSSLYTWLEGGSIPGNVALDFGGRS